MWLLMFMFSYFLEREGERERERERNLLSGPTCLFMYFNNLFFMGS